MTHVIIRTLLLGSQPSGVKRIALVLALLAGLVAAPFAKAQVAENYGQSLILQALLWTPNYLETSDRFARLLETQDSERNELVQGLIPILKQIRERSLREDKKVEASPGVYVRHSFRQNSIVKFRAEASGLFQLPDAGRARTAVTGDEIASDIIFNSDKTSDFKTFTFAQAIRLLIHEAGHKYKAGRRNLLPAELEVLQTRIDKLAAEIGDYYGSRATVLAEPLIAVTGAPFNSPGASDGSPLHGWYPQRKFSQFWLIKDAKIKDFSEALSRALDPKDSRRNYFDIERKILGIQILSPQNSGETRALIQLVNYRRPINTNHYLTTDIGGPFYYSAEVSLKDDELKVLNYVDAGPKLKRAVDAEIEIPEFNLSPDGSFTGRLKLIVETKFNFHSGSYPIHRGGALTFYAKGQTVRVPIEMHAVVDKAWSGMPDEIYQKKMEKRSFIEGRLPEGWPRDFEITGLVDGFFELGHVNYEVPLKLVTMKTPLHVQGCAELLKKSI